VRRPYVTQRAAVLPYERFDAWRFAHHLTLEVYAATRDFPLQERFGLTSQARRAAYSAAANIAEGSAKSGPREFRRYLDISLGSLSELAYALRLARDLGFLSEDRWRKVENLRDEAGKLCWGLYRSLGPR
jgi:four helix bundle protein